MTFFPNRAASCCWEKKKKVGAVDDYNSIFCCISTVSEPWHCTTGRKKKEKRKKRKTRIQCCFCCGKLLLPLSKQDLQILPQSQWDHSHRTRSVHLATAAGCRLYEPTGKNSCGLSVAYVDCVVRVSQGEIVGTCMVLSQPPTWVLLMKTLGTLFCPVISNSISW